MGTGPNGNLTDVQAKAHHVHGPGVYDMSLEPGWRSISIIKGHEYHIDRGTINLSAYQPRGDAHAVGTLSFEAGGHPGQCSFNVSVMVQDMPRLMGDAKR